MHIMGSHVEDIVPSFELSKEDKDNYSIIKEAFDMHYVARKTKILYMKELASIQESSDQVRQLNPSILSFTQFEKNVSTKPSAMN